MGLCDGRAGGGNVIIPSRLRLLAVLSVALLLAAGCDWNRFGYDLGGSRSNSSDTSISSFNASTLTTAWIGTTGAAVGTSSAVTSGSHVFIASQDGLVYTFDEAGHQNCVAGSPTACSPMWTSAPEVS